MDDEVVFATVRLEQYAGVMVALAEGIALDDVLAQEQITADNWSVARPKWRETLADSPDLQMTYRQKRRQAEDALARKVEPVDEDPVAWSGLLAAVNATDDIPALLRKLEISASDLSRLGRHWNRKAEKDPEIVKKLNESAGKAPAPKSLRVGPVELKPFPWTKGGGSAATRAPAATSVGDGVFTELATPVGGVLPVERDVDLYAALSVVLQLLPQETRRILPICGLDERRHADLASKWRVRFDSDPDLDAAFKMHAADHRAAMRRMLAGAKGVLSP